jgi:hypothetical protein
MGFGRIGQGMRLRQYALQFVKWRGLIRHAEAHYALPVRRN